MQTVEELFRFLCTLAPLELQMDFDNAGFLVGRRGAEVSRVLLSLDITHEAIDEAIEYGAELIVSHHPVIFHKLGSLTDAGQDDKVLRLAEHGIAAICMHTNLDIAAGGVNDVLIARLGAFFEDTLDAQNCGRVGTLPEAMPLEQFMQRCKTALGVAALRYVDAGKPVRRLGVLGGAGGDELREAWEKGCDTYVTADVKYHQFLDALELGVNLIDADHFCTEAPVLAVLAEKMSAAFPALDVRLSKRRESVIRFY